MYDIRTQEKETRYFYYQQSPLPRARYGSLGSGETRSPPHTRHYYRDVCGENPIPADKIHFPSNSSTLACDSASALPLQRSTLPFAIQQPTRPECDRSQPTPSSSVRQQPTRPECYASGNRGNCSTKGCNGKGYGQRRVGVGSFP